MKSKSGISLIVLVITIVVIIILAAAVLLTINNNNPIDNANEAVTESDRSETQSAITLFLGSVMADVKQSVVIEGTDETDTSVYVPIVGAAIKTKKTPQSDIYYDKTKSEYTLTDPEDGSSPITFTADGLGIDGAVLENLQVNCKGNVK